MGLLRVLLALSVALVHFGGLYGFKPTSGAAAVEAFFVISGFYMYLVLHEKYYAAGIKSFYAARYMRLIPSYVVVALLTLGVLAATGASSRQIMPWHDTWTYIANAPVAFQAFWLVSNFAIFFSDFQILLGFDGQAAWWIDDFRASPVQVWRMMLIPQGWSLGNELWFYLLAPFALRKLWRMILVTAISLAVIAWLHFTGLPWDPWAHRFTPSVLHMFLLGSFACWIWKRWLQNLSWLPIVGAVGLAALVTTLIAWPFITVDANTLRHGFVWATAILIAPIFSLTRSSKLDAWIGELSYPIYVCHLLALLIASWRVEGSHTAVLAMALTIGISLGLVYFVERPADRWRHAKFATSAPSPNRAT